MKATARRCQNISQCNSYQGYQVVRTSQSTDCVARRAALLGSLNTALVVVTGAAMQGESQLCRNLTEFKTNITSCHEGDSGDTVAVLAGDTETQLKATAVYLIGLTQ